MPLSLIRRQIPDVDRFIAVSDYCARYMTELFAIPAPQMSVVPLGIDTTGYTMAAPASDVFTDRLLRAHRAGEGAARARARRTCISSN